MDPCTDLVIRMLQGSPSHFFTNLYLVSVCTSRSFLQALYDSNAYATATTVKDKMIAVWKRIPVHKCFSNSFNPQRIVRRQVLATPPKKRKALILGKLAKQPLRPRLRNPKHKFVNKLHLTKQIRKMKMLGPFQAKNYYQFWRAALDRDPVPQGNSFCETGPGCRAAVNYLHGYPVMLLKYKSSLSAAMFYNDRIAELRQKLLANDLLKDAPTDNEVVKQAKNKLRKLLDTVEGVQFAMCELGKMFTFLLTGNDIYVRHHWNAQP